MNPRCADGHRVVRQGLRQEVAVRAMSNAPTIHGVDIKPEAKREHEGDGSAAPRS
jgi:hypothetical protein